MKKYGLLCAILFATSLPSSQENRCVSNSKCDCFYSLDEFEFQCPPNEYAFVIRTKPKQYMKIECNNLTDYDLDLFPDFRAGDLKNFLIRFCPLPKSDYGPILGRFNISVVKNLKLEENYISDHSLATSVTKELFVGMTYLEKLEITRLSDDLEVDFLQYLPNLIQLYLDNNSIENIGLMFQYTSRLKILDLSRNALTEIPDGEFENLSDLLQLHLWSNKLTNLTKHAFTGLVRLKSLELSINYIEFIEENTFAELVNLVHISLRSNNLNYISPNTFKHNSLLEGIRIGYNPNLILPDYLFANLTKLLDVNLDNSNLQNVPEHIFEGCHSLENAFLQTNNLTDLPENLFKPLKKLKKLNLSHNKLKMLSDTIFSTLNSLEDLNLENNDIVEINDSIFNGLTNLKNLNLRNNKIATISLSAFVEQKKLVRLDLSENLYELKYNIENIDPFNACVNLEDLNLAHNLVDTFPEGIMLNKVSLKNLDLRYNRIEQLEVSSLIKVSRYQVDVNLSSNNISKLDFTSIKSYSLFNPQSYDAYHNNDSSTVLYMFNNRLVCDCRNFDLVQYFHNRIDPVIKTLVDIRIGDSRCFQPEEFKHVRVASLNPYHITCKYPSVGCPYQCECFQRPYDGAVVVDCYRRNLTECPKISLRSDRVELNLRGNMLQNGPNMSLGYENVTNMFLSNNKIKDLKWVPSNIENLDLDGNQLTFIEQELLSNLSHSSTLKNLTLYNNPWACGCSATNLQNFLRKNYEKVNITRVICKDDRIPLINKVDLCKSYAMIAMQIVIPISIFFIIIAVAWVLFVYYKQEIKVWLYSNKLCLRYVTEKELDKDKIYDVFISYSHKDEDFVVQELLPVLESGPNPYKICIHIRDFLPGEFITKQITSSVKNSRRTLVVLSDNFMESVWGKMEFRTAHTQAIEEGRARVIVVKCGSLTEEKLDEEIKVYLKTNTYVEWGTPWFWNKLRYALPHSHKNDFYRENQKLANTMLKIDDKFELTSPPLSHPDSTPPVISMEPPLLKNHPLAFKASRKMQTPPAEAPLIISR